MEGKELTVAQGGAVLRKPQWNEEELKLIRESVGTSGSYPSPAEFNIFLWTASQYQLNPFLKEIWCVPFSGKWTPIVAFDTYVAWAKEKGFAYFTTPGYVVRDSREPNADNKEITARQYDPRHHQVVACYVSTVDAQGKELPEVIAFFDEYAPRGKGGDVYGTWKQKPIFYLTKAAMKKALKEHYAVAGPPIFEDLAMYTQEVIDIGPAEARPRVAAAGTVQKPDVGAPNPVTPPENKPVKEPEEQTVLQPVSSQDEAMGVPPPVPDPAPVTDENPHFAVLQIWQKFLALLDSIAEQNRGAAKDFCKRRIVDVWNANNINDIPPARVKEFNDWLWGPLKTELEQESFLPMRLG